MRRLGTVALWLAGGLMLSASARAGNVVLAGNPYEPIVTRNVFGLNPPPPPGSTTTEDPQLPKITLNGITDILGQLQALFKVAPKPGQKDAKEESYILSEGQAQDEIEVVRINQKDALVTFNNHGTVQEIPLADAPKLNTPGPAGVIGSGNSGGGLIPVPPRFGGPRINGPGGPAAHFGGQRGGGGNSSAPGGNPTLNSIPTRMGSGYSEQSQDNLSPEARMIMLEAQRAQLQKEGNPAAAIIPPTALTPLLKGGENRP